VAFSTARASARKLCARGVDLWAPGRARPPERIAAADSTRFLGDSRGSRGVEDKTGSGRPAPIRDGWKIRGSNSDWNFSARIEIGIEI